MKVNNYNSEGIIYTPYISTISNIFISNPETPKFHSVNPDHMYIPITSTTNERTDFETEEIIPVSIQPVFNVSDVINDNTPSSNLDVARTMLTSRTGAHQFKTSDIQVGEMQGFLDVLDKNNIHVRVTSGVRPGATTSSGNISRHDDGHAIDITPIEGET